MTVVGFDEVVAQLGEFVRLRLKDDISSFEQYEEITADDGMTAIIQEINSNQRIMKILPVNGIFVSINETITGTDSGQTATVMNCEATYLEQLELRARNFIENYTNRLYGSTASVTQKFTTKADRSVYWTEDRPLNSVTSVVLDGVTLTEDQDYFVNLERGEFDFHTPLVSDALQPYNLVITYNHGQTTVPEIVQQAAVMYISYFWKKRNHNSSMKGASSMSFGGRSVGWTQQGNFDELKKEIEQILIPVAMILFDSF